MNLQTILTLFFFQPFAALSVHSPYTLLRAVVLSAVLSGWITYTYITNCQTNHSVSFAEFYSKNIISFVLCSYLLPSSSPPFTVPYEAYTITTPGADLQVVFISSLYSSICAPQSHKGSACNSKMLRGHFSKIKRKKTE